MSTLYIDLPHTTMEDFTEHFERALQRSSRFLLLVNDTETLEPIVTLRYKGGPVPGKVANVEEFLALVRNEDLPDNPDPSTFVMFLVDRTEIGRTQLVYWIAVQKEVGVTYTLLMQVIAIRFRQDKLRVILVEYSEPPTRTPAFRKWLGLLWGNEEKDDGIVVIEESQAKAIDAIDKPSLTPAEHNVADYLARGLNDQEISEKLVKSAATVETQRKALARKLGISADKNTIGEELRRLGFSSV